MLPKRYFQTFTLLLLSFFALSLQGCATQGYDGVDTTRKAILVSTAEVRQANVLLQDLINRGVVDNEKATDILGKLRDANRALQTALNAINVHSDPVTAESNLARANITISIALSLLSDFT